LNFEGDGIRIVGGCDLYTTKAAGSDKKLYKRIDKTLEAQFESQLRIAASLSPPQAAQFAKTSNLSQSSPFGALSQTANRRTYSYMIATLNASHPDYDFSNVLRPADFVHEDRIKNSMDQFDSKVYGAKSTRIPPGLQTPGGSATWGPRIWKAIDDQMDLYKCEVYSYKPDQNPFDDEESAIWSLHYFFFNKTMKRVCYLYARALSPSWTEDVQEYDSDDGTAAAETPPPGQKRRYAERQSADYSARKRARFWLGDKAEYIENDWEPEHDDSGVEVEDDEEAELEAFIETVKRGRSMSSNISEEDGRTGSRKSTLRKRSHVRNMDEAVAEAIEL
jgi:Maf1 regulator